MAIATLCLSSSSALSTVRYGRARVTTPRATQQRPAFVGLALEPGWIVCERV
jgi:hypothetical protein